MSETVENFLNELQSSISSGTFAKLTLGNYRGRDEDLQKVTARVIDTKRGRKIAFQNKYTSRETVRNYEPADVVNLVRELLESGFRNAHLFTTSNDFQLTVGKKNARLIAVKPTFNALPGTEHDRRKRTVVSSNAPYLKALGIATDAGEIKPQQRDKWRQINKFVEILRDLFERSALRDRTNLKIIDMGSGKGYLTFATYDYFSRERGLNVEMTGVDTRLDLVRLCNEIAASCGFDGLRFEVGSIADQDVGDVDILIALHACDTATDDALYKGIAGKAEIIVAAPCCHKEIRKQIKPPDVLRDILKHGTMLEREAETITDGLRAMLLERSGYSTKVFEFVPTEHTPKNNMIVATMRGTDDTERRRLQAQIDSIKSLYGIREQRLENHLA